MPLDPTIRSLIGQFRRSPVWDSQLDLEVIQRFWPELVGDQLAAAIKVTAIHGNKSHCECTRSDLAKAVDEYEAPAARKDKRAVGRSQNYGDCLYL
jgi:hypothetical protein